MTSGPSKPESGADSAEADEVVDAFSILVRDSAGDWFSCFDTTPVTTSLVKL